MYPTILEVSFICLLGVAVIGTIGRHVRFLPQQKKKKKGAGCWVTAVHVAANQCQTAWETGQLSMTWLRVASCSWQAACGQRCDSGVPLWMCLWKAPTMSLPCSRRQTTTRPGLSKAAEWAALSEWARRHRLRDWAAHVMTDTRRSADELPQPSPAMLQSTARLSTTWLSGPECNHAPDQWTPRLSQPPSTAGRSSSITL